VFLTVLLLAAFGVSALATWVALSAPPDRGLDARLVREARALQSIYASHPPKVALRLMHDRERQPAGFNYRVADAAGRRVAGDLPETNYIAGFDTLDADDLGVTPAAEGPLPGYRVLSVPLAGGGRLTLGEDLMQSRQLRLQFLRSFFLASGSALLIALAVGLSYVTRSFGRLEAIARTADAIRAGDLSLRAPVRIRGGRGDDIDNLALAMNRMLDRVAELLQNVRQVSDDVAHDLRTPLAHLKQRVETALAGPPSLTAYEAALEGASEKIDEVLATFQALLSIGQVEAGATASDFHPVDLADVVTAVVEAFRPSAEDAEHQLVLHAPRPVMIRGDRPLLNQLVANLLENALAHTPAGSSVEIRAEPHGALAQLTVEDDGPGVPDAELAKIFRRFYRVERSRTTPGSGLGLSLAAAVARRHRAEIRAEDAAPGLRVVVEFPALASALPS
jgi:signal transduction histidine kinase